jgi:spermidine/putrescine ABC transporter ATP-binding subunit
LSTPAPAAASSLAEEARPADVEVVSAYKSYGEVTAVNGVDLLVRAGEFFTMLGPSGSGKTTTLRLIAGFEHPDSGRVLLGGEDVTRVPPFARDVNTVFQDYALFPHMTVGENVAYGLRVKKVPRPERRRRVDEALEMVRLTGFGARRPGQLSGGQRQRVALARAIVNRPRVLLLDEPLGALDLKLRQQMQIELKRIQEEVGITFVYVTHDQEEALTMSDRIAVMNRGVIEQVADPETVYERPATTFVAGFIGVSNLMPGEVVSSNGAGAELKLDAGPTVRTSSSGGAGVRERVHAVVRPEKLVLRSADDGGIGGDGASVEGQVESSLYLGTATQMVVRLGDDTRMTVLVPNADAEARHQLPAAGDAARLSWSSENIHIVREAVGGHEAAAAEGSNREDGEA